MGTYNASAIEHHLKGGSKRHFQPRGPSHLVECAGAGRSRAKGRAREDSIEDWGPGGLAARIFVGLNVGETPTYTVEDVVHATRDIRREQGKLPDATFIAQKGLYTEPEYRGAHLIEENSVQIIIFDIDGSSLDVFAANVVQLAAALRKKFDQDSVIVEIQNAGVSQKLINVKRDPA